MYKSRRNISKIAFSVSLIFVWAASAFGQGFMVKPTRLEISLPAGRTGRLPLEIRNTIGEEQQLDIRIVDLTQSDSGSWAIVPDVNSEKTQMASCRDWFRLGNDTVTIEAQTTFKPEVKIAVPVSARGTYFAGILVQQPDDPDAEGISLRIRFLIPVILHIEGRAGRQNIVLEDLSLQEDKVGKDQVSVLMAKMHIRNAGQTYSKVGGQLVVERSVNERWRVVKRIEFAEKGIIPGVTLKLGRPIDKALPSGIYRLRGDLWIDGRRAKNLRKEIEWEGKGSVDDLTFDSPLVLDPAMLQIDAAPGAIRRAVVNLENPGEDPLNVQINIRNPDTLQGVAMGALRGEALCATQWLEVSPSRVTVRPAGRQRFQVLAKVPRESLSQANYYAELLLNAFYPDGQPAGKASAIVILENKELESEDKGVINGLSMSATEEPSEYAVQARFYNIGNVHLEPEPEIEILAANGKTVTLDVEGHRGMLLPMGHRDYSREIDFTDLDEGRYTVRFNVRSGNGKLFRDDFKIDIAKPATDDGAVAESEDTSIRTATVVEETD